MHATVVKFNALTDANRPASDGDQTLFGTLFEVGDHVNSRGTKRFVGGVVIGRFCGKLSGTGVHHPVNGMQVDIVTPLHDGSFVLTRRQGLQPFSGESGQRIGDVSVAETKTLPSTEFFFAQFSRRDRPLNDLPFHVR